MERTSYIVILLVSLLYSSMSQRQVTKDGSCLNVDAMQTFDVNRFGGRWFEFAATPLDIEENTKCNQFVRYPPNGNQWPISWLHKKNDVKHNVTKITKLIAPGKGENEDGTQIIFVQVDYDKYALVYACKPLPNDKRKENVWFLTRQQYPTSHIVSMLNDYPVVLEPLIRTLKVKDQKDCPII